MSVKSLLDLLLSKINTSPEAVEFSEVIDAIAAHYNYTPANFTNGETKNEAGTNEGSCKIFAFAQLNQLTVDQTLHCFGDYYREDVLEHPEGTDHANIRNFMVHGWDGIKFESAALVKKA